MEKIRFNLELTKSAKDQLDQLQARTGATSLAEVIRRSLALYDALDEKKTEGWEIILRRKKDKVEQPVLLI